jgi:hypothetical protein
MAPAETVVRGDAHICSSLAGANLREATASVEPQMHVALLRLTRGRSKWSVWAVGEGSD